MPPPGTDAQLAEQVARIVSRPLDRARPLWELYLIHGLSGHKAVMTKIHHSVIDGMSGAEIMGALLDLSPKAARSPRTAPLRRRRAERARDARARAARAAAVPAAGAARAPATLPNLDETPLATLPGAGAIGRIASSPARARRRRRIVDRHKLVAPKTSFNGRVSPHRRVVFGQLSLDDVKAAKNEHGTTVNDVIVSICAGAVRRWMIEHDELLDEPLVTQIPVSVRTDDQVGTYGNRIQLMSAPLYTKIADPVDRLLRTHDALGDMKARHRALPAELLQDANEFIPPAVFARAARVTFALSTSRAGRPAWNLVISNVPGPQFPLYLAGAELKANYPVSVITDGMGLNITVMSYRGHLDFGIVADREQMPDVARLMDWLGEELAALEPSGRAKRTSAQSAPASSTS